MRRARLTPRHLALVALGVLLLVAASCAQRPTPGDPGRPEVLLVPADISPTEAGPTADDDAPRREVTLFGVVATPGTPSVDPRLEEVGMVPQLRQFLGECSGCGVKLLGSETRERLAARQSVTLDLEQGYTASTELVDPLNEHGKVRLKLTLSEHGQPKYVVDLTTPPDQPVFCDKNLADGRRLLLMVGAH